MLWEIDLHPAADQPDRAGQRLASAARELGLANHLCVAAARGFLIQGDSFTRDDMERFASELLTDRVVERAVVGQMGEDCLNEVPLRFNEKRTTSSFKTDRGLSPCAESAEQKGTVTLCQSGFETRSGKQGVKENQSAHKEQLISVLLKPGVMDPVAQSVITAANDLGIRPEAVATLRKYWISGADETQAQSLGERLLANDAIEQVYFGPLVLDRLELGRSYVFQLRTVEVRNLDDDALMKLSREGQLYLQLAEMQTIRRHFRELGREPTDVELETIAQTWSEHCSHKTLTGRIAYRDETGERQFDNMLKETIFAATQTIRERLDADDWCVSVFEDNAGVVQFDENFNLAFKVETHNHPSALEPYGGANTGVGGVIRDIMGTGLGAKPICSTDVFCFAPPELERREKTECGRWRD
ncbi:MAG TPA: AIR synthase related protein, partial [Lacipirellulaceae bacterium]|nr:AIR synthase related protein [Lacipirellulaceae bacterium]